MTPFEKALAAGIRFAQERYARAIESIAHLIKQVASRAHRSVEEEINAIPGVRLFFTPIKSRTFTSTEASTDPFAKLLIFALPKDGYWVMTHYPLPMWKISASATATDVGKWQPISAWPLPAQQNAAETIDLSLSFRDSGSERWFNSAARPRSTAGATPGEPLPDFLRHVPASNLSSPLALKRLPVPTLFRPKSALACSPRYDDVNFTNATEGTLVVALIGYKIASA